MTKLPRKNKHWQKEIADAISESIKLAEAESGVLSAGAKENLFKYAAMFAAKNRAVQSREDRVAMSRYAAQARARDFQLSPGDVSNYDINFMLAYLDAHRSLDLISEKKLDDIMAFMTVEFEPLIQDA
ncbi:hypothetical protein [Kistimonas asteriae]|uniref:hypothetical protein n=1 Tax=Kistimonas asteriae TaxID=517724 RepID=UPI001BA697E6|nr:hypothetical protein [Kistimonas asteriae]